MRTPACCQRCCHEHSSPEYYYDQCSMRTPGSSSLTLLCFFTSTLFFVAEFIYLSDMKPDEGRCSDNLQSQSQSQRMLKVSSLRFLKRVATVFAALEENVICVFQSWLLTVGGGWWRRWLVDATVFYFGIVRVRKT